MKHKIFLFLLLLPLLSFRCNKEGDNCHHVITIKNKSSEKIIYSTKGTLGIDPSKCLLIKKAELEPNELYEEMLGRMCWEEELEYRNFEFFIVDTSNFNLGGFYDCDSIEYYNTILKHYIITKNDLENLRNNNFTITYP